MTQLVNQPDYHPPPPDIAQWEEEIAQPFNVELDVTHRQIVNIDLIKKPEHHRRYGTTYTYEVMTDEQTPYVVHVGEPRDRRSDIPVVFTTAWLTSSHGHNAHTRLKMMDLGFPVIEIGPEGEANKNLIAWAGSIALNPIGYINQLKKIDLVNTAESMHTIVDQLPTEHTYNHDEIVLLGESRGAMIGMGMQALAASHYRKVIYADLVAPCFADKFNSANLWRYKDQLPGEVLGLAHLLGKTSLRRMLHYPNTLNLHPNSVLHSAATIKTLLSGQAGELARYQLDKGHKAYISTFSGDVGGQSDTWHEIFRDYPGIVIKELPGTHLSLAHEDTFRGITDRLGTLVHELDQHDDDPSKVDFSRVHLDD